MLFVSVVVTGVVGIVIVIVIVIIDTVVMAVIVISGIVVIDVVDAVLRVLLSIMPSSALRHVVSHATLGQRCHERRTKQSDLKEIRGV